MSWAGLPHRPGLPAPLPGPTSSSEAPSSPGFSPVLGLRVHHTAWCRNCLGFWQTVRVEGQGGPSQRGPEPRRWFSSFSNGGRDTQEADPCPRPPPAPWDWQSAGLGETLASAFAMNFSHPSTNQARPCLASEIRQDRACSGWCGRRLLWTSYLGCCCHGLRFPGFSQPRRLGGKGAG